MAMDIMAVERETMTQVSRTSEEDKIDISGTIDDMFKGLRRFWALNIVIVIACTGLYYLIQRMTWKPVYKAYSTFTVSAKNTMGYNAGTYNNQVASQLGNVFPYILNSDAMKQIVSSDLGVTSVPGDIQATVLEDTNLITISVTSSSKYDAYNILQSVLTNYPRLSEYVIGDVSLDPVDESGTPQSPMNPFSKQKTLAQGAVIGILAVILFLLIYALTRHTIRNEEDLKEILNVPVLSDAPHVRLKRQSHENTMMIDNRAVSSEFVEAIRTLRSRFETACQEKQAKKILITSSIPGEGKTTIICNLAYALTRRGFKVLLIDGDLRNPSVALTLGRKLKQNDAKGGLLAYLKGDIEAYDLIRRYHKLDVIAGNDSVDDTVELLNSSRMKTLIEQGGIAYDYVLIDTPPSAVVSDAAILLQYTDGYLYVVRQDYARTSQILEGIDLLSDSRVPAIGCILNDVEQGVTGYGSYNNSYYSYGYKSRHYSSYDSQTEN